MSTLVLLPTLLVLGQFPRPLPNATIKTAAISMNPVNTKASSTFNTGFVPFEMNFTCTFDFVGPKNGCYAVASVNFDIYDAQTDTYPWRGKQPGSVQLQDLMQAEIHLSGIQVYTNWNNSTGTLSFAELYVDTRTVDLNSNTVSWYVHANWRDLPPSMVDTFEVKISGEVVWSTNINSRIWAVELNCTDTAASCASGKSVNGTMPIVGAALGKTRFVLNNGSLISGLSNRVTYFTVSPTRTMLTADCGIGGASDISCSQRVIALAADATEAAPFLSKNFVASGLAAQVIGQTELPGTFSAHKEMACGLREFNAYVRTPGKFGGLHVGANSTDCGFSGTPRGYPPATWTYNGQMWHGFRIEDTMTPPLQGYDSEFKLDGAALFWP